VLGLQERSDGFVGLELSRLDCRSLLKPSEQKTQFAGGVRLSELPDPRNVREAMTAHDADGWKEAMNKEMENLKSHDVYELVPRVKGLRTVRD
jgi:hypothetical protein